ncbi:MAG: hypothetical protein ACX93T_00425 [Bacteroidota bacterium]
MTMFGASRKIRISFTLLGFSLITDANATSISVEGLKFDQIKEIAPQLPIQKPTEGSMLNDLLQEHNFKASSIERTSIQLKKEARETSGISNATSSDNLDEETAQKIKKASKANTSKIQANLHPHHKSLAECYLRKDEMPTDTDMPGSSFTQKLCVKLARDALKIANTHTSHRTREATTCLCVVLSNKEGNAQKLMFHSGERLPPSIRSVAGQLRYSFNSYKGHSEAQFIHFLLDDTSLKQYTYILGMGCSRLHCKECDSLLKLGLGKDYHKFTAAMRQESIDPQNPTFENTEDYKCVIIKVPDRAQEKHMALEEERAIRKSARPSKNKYDLTKALINWTKEMTGWDLSSQKRFH